MGKAGVKLGDQGVAAAPAEAAAMPPSARELIDFVALILLAIKEEVEDLQQVQNVTARSFAEKLVELGKQLPGSPVMGEVVSLMQSDDLRSQRQQHVINALRYVEDIIRDQSGRGWAPRLTDRAAGWGEGLIASQTLEQVRAHFHHYLLGAAVENPHEDSSSRPAAADVELF